MALATKLASDAQPSPSDKYHTKPHTKQYQLRPSSTKQLFFNLIHLSLTWICYEWSIYEHPLNIHLHLSFLWHTKTTSKINSAIELHTKLTEFTYLNALANSQESKRFCD